jgi:Leucine-rich repeat (LRR) protein
LAADTDGDGLLDFIDVPGLNPNASGHVDLSRRGIQDLDGATFLTSLQSLDLHSNQITSLENGDFDGLGNLKWLDLSGNQITSIEDGAFEGLSNLEELHLGLCAFDFCFGNQTTTIENGDFQGLDNLQLLLLTNNQIASIENGAFQGLDNLQIIDLRRNSITNLNLTGATFGKLIAGIFADETEITDLSLDHAVLSQDSFQTIVSLTQYISNVSLVGLEFSHSTPANLSALLNISTLDNVRVDQGLFDRYATEFSAFDAILGNTVTMVPETEVTMLVLVAVVGMASWRRFSSNRQQCHSTSDKR